MGCRAWKLAEAFLQIFVAEGNPTQNPAPLGCPKLLNYGAKTLFSGIVGVQDFFHQRYVIIFLISSILWIAHSHIENPCNEESFSGLLPQ